MNNPIRIVTRQDMDHMNTRHGGSTQPKPVELPPIIQARISAEVASMLAEAEKLQARQERRSPIVGHRKAWWWDGFLIAGVVIFAGWAAVRMIGGR